MVLLFLILKGYFFNSKKEMKNNIGDLSLKLIDYNQIELEKGNWYFVVILSDSVSHYSFIKYLNYLLDNIYNDYKLHLIIFSISTETNSSKYMDTANKKTSIFSLRGNNISIMPLLRESRHQRVVCLIGPSGNVIFEANFAQENDVRLILEKYLIGKINYNRKDDFSIKKGDSLYPLVILNIKSGEEITIDEKMCPFLWIIFTSNCVSCALQSNLMTYSTLENILSQKFNLKVGLIFSPYFSMEEIEFRINQLNIVNEVFISKVELKKIENIYYKSPDNDKNVIALIINTNNKVIYIEPFTVFYNHIKGDYFEKNYPSFIKE
jgi:hypothetical protein